MGGTFRVGFSQEVRQVAPQNVEQVAPRNVSICRAAVYNGSGASSTCANASFEILASAPNFEVKSISAEEIQQGKLREFDVVLFLGGTGAGSGEAKALGDKGWKELRAFLNGGGYLRTCVGGRRAWRLLIERVRPVR